MKVLQNFRLSLENLSLTNLLLAALSLSPAFGFQEHTALGQDVDTVDRDYSSELPRIAPLTAEQSWGEFEVLDGFEVQLVACEPLVTDPVAFAFDAKGRLWVVEMRDYSEQATENLGRIAVLTDDDGDGKMDRRSTFAENLSWPTAIWPWLDGILVAEPPRITWYRDRNGDEIADDSEQWYSGFGRSNVQGLVNSLRWGVDGWIHGATSSSGAQLQSAADASPIDLGRRDFAIDPTTRQLKPESGGGQHGMSFNRWGDKFVTSNSDHLQQIVDLESWLAGRTSTVAFPAVRRSIAEDGPQAEVFRSSPVEPWRIVRTRLRVSGVVPGIVEGGGRDAGYFTGATGTWIMDRERGFGHSAAGSNSGDHLGDDGTEGDTAIVCDVGSNLVHRKRLIDQGLFWTAQRIDHATELLRSRDIWFRPVQVGDGPDGALYIADMYREVIEHPQSLPPMIKKHLDLTSGRDRGRIWRVTKVATPYKKHDDLTQLNDQALVQRLESNIAWQRLTASQLLCERNVRGLLDQSTAGRLEQLALRSERAEARVLSVWLLSRLGLWRPEFTQFALQQEHPRALAHVIEIIGQLDQAATVSPRLLEIARESSDSRVQLALAKAADGLDPNEQVPLLSALMPQVREPLVQATLALAAGNRSWRLLQAADNGDLDDALYLQWLTMLLPSWMQQVPAERDLSDFISQALKSENSRRQLWLSALVNAGSHTRVSALLKAVDAQAVVDAQVVAALEKSVDRESIGQLGLASHPVRADWMQRLIRSNTAESLQAATIEALGWANHDELPDRLIQEFRSLTPALQQVVLRVLIARPELLQKLVEALEGQQIARSQISPEIRQSLISQTDKSLGQRFQQVLNQASADRAAIIDRYQSFFESVQPDRSKSDAGKAVFQRACAHCHRLGEIGNDVGPPLKQLSAKSPEQLLISILDPSQEVDPKYAAYSILTEDGVVLSGIIVQEIGSQIVVAEAGGKQTVLDRESIQQIQSTGLSLMPNGLEEQITPDQMSELISFLKQVQ